MSQAKSEVYVSKWQSALAAIGSTELAMPELQALLRQLLATDPGLAPQLQAQLDQALREGNLSHAAYVELSRDLPFTRARSASDEMASAHLDAQTLAATQLAVPSDTAAMRVLKERFVLESEIARGGMGVVYKARDLRKEEARDRDPYVAIKVLTEAFQHHPDAFVALQREAKKAQQLAHPNVVTVYDFDRDADTIFLTMEYLQGESLGQRLLRNGRKPLPQAEAIAIIQGMARGLAYAHSKQIVHSDFKPGNVFITQDGTVKILDFGIARAVQEQHSGQADTTVFDAASLNALTPSYASCEMLERLPPDPRDDIYALACVAYELLSGRHPFGRARALDARNAGAKPAAIKGLSRRQWNALLHGLAFARQARTPSVIQFLDEIGAARRRGGMSRGMRWGLLSLPVLMLLVMGGLWLWDQYGKWEATDSLPPGLREQVQQLLATAEAHASVYRLTEPPGSNAVDTYQAVQALHPLNREAHNSLRAIAQYFVQQADGLCTESLSQDCASSIRQGLKAEPDNAALRDLALRYGLPSG